MALLYQYQRDNESRLKELEHGLLYVSDPSTFNDPQDMKLRVTSMVEDRWSSSPHFEESMRNALRNLMTERKEFERALLFDADLLCGFDAWLNDTLVDGLDSLSSYVQRRIDKLGVACFTRTFENRLMWAHYANNGKGFCVQYEVTPLKNTVDLRYVPVRYVSELEQLCVTEAIFSPHQFLYRAIGIKHTDWAYEREVRLVSLNEKGKKVNVASEFLRIKRLIGGHGISSVFGECLRTAAARLNVPYSRASFDLSGNIFLKGS